MSNINYINSTIIRIPRPAWTMSRKSVSRRLPPLPKTPLLRQRDNKTELLLGLLRDFARSNQGGEALLFYSQREVARKYAVPASLVAKIYRTLEAEGLLRPIRGSGTLLEGSGPTPRSTAHGLLAIASSLPRFLTEQDARIFLLQMQRECRKRNVIPTAVFFEGNETADMLGDRLKISRPDRIIWYSPQRLSREVALRTHDAGIPIIGIADIGYPAIPCQYEVCRWPALRKIVGEWKRDAALARVRVALGPARSAAEEARIGRTLAEMDLDAQFIRLRSQTIRHFIDSLVKNPTSGIIVESSAASILATHYPGAFARLAKYSRLALVGGPVRGLHTMINEATVDMVVVDWRVVARRILDDFLRRSQPARDEPCVFEALAEYQVPVGRDSQTV